jgi:hypothetical protein
LVCHTTPWSVLCQSGGSWWEVSEWIWHWHSEPRLVLSSSGSHWLPGGTTPSILAMCGRVQCLHSMAFHTATPTRGDGKRHQFAEVFTSTSIVARELRYNSPIQHVEAQGWTFSGNQKYSIVRFKRAYSKKQLGHLRNYMLASRPW